MTRTTDFIFSAAAALWAALLWAGKGRPGGLIIMKERGNRDVKKNDICTVSPQPVHAFYCPTRHLIV